MQQYFLLNSENHYHDYTDFLLLLLQCLSHEWLLKYQYLVSDQILLIQNKLFLHKEEFYHENTITNHSNQDTVE